MAVGMLDGLVDQYKSQFHTSTVFGIPLDELTREQLMAMVCHMGEMEKSQRDQAKRDRDFMMDLMKAQRKGHE